MRKPSSSISCGKRTVATLILIFGLLFANAATAAAESAPVRYLLDLRDPASHLVRVTMDIPGAARGTEFQIPTWNNLYQIRDFVRDIQDVQAACKGEPAPLRRVDVNTWESLDECPDLKLHYEAYANEDDVFSAVLDSRHAFLNFALLLFYLPRERQRPVRVRFLLPEGWKLVTMLDDGPQPGEYQAPDYDHLADSPAEAGSFQEYDYQQNGATYRVTVDGDRNLYSPGRILNALKKITLTETSLMEDVPFKRYTFMFFFPQSGSGGMEHRDGTAISIPAAEMRGGLGSLESTAAHEFFHLWNVKRIRPKGLEPIDYIRGNDTSDLWFSEGVTSTYAELVLLRAGLIKEKDFYKELAEAINDLQSRPARRFQSVEESGREAWLEKYPDYFRPARSISYYNKGELLGYLLDLGIRHASDNRYSLDDLMRRLNLEFARQGRYFDDADLKRIIHELAPAFPCDEFFRDDITGTRELDYAKYLAYAGLELKTERVAAPDLGFESLQGFIGPVHVETVEPGSNAAIAGIQPGDVLLKMNGVELPVTPERELIYFRPGQRVTFTVQRGTRVFDVSFVLGSKPATIYKVEKMPNPTPAQKALRDSWLKGIRTSFGEKEH
jgi:predicted metalloprotease with PDZ domain